MNKTELVAEVAAKSGLTKKAAREAVTFLFDSISDSLKKGEKVRIVGFGVFEIRNRDAHSGRDPRTGEKINIASSKAPAFKAGKTLKNAINK